VDGGFKGGGEDGEWGKKKEREGQRRKGRNCTESFGPSSKLLESRGHTQSAVADGPRGLTAREYLLE